MKAILRTGLILVVTLLFSACASMQSSKAPGTDLSQLKTFYVQKLPADGRGVEKLISDRLNAMGYLSTHGEAEAPSAPADAIVTYQDKWMWDITMYMLQLDVQVRDAATRAILASGQSYRPSLQRKAPEGMVEEVLNEIFKKEQQ